MATIFVDESRKRKWLFRILAASIFSGAFACLALFSLNVVFNATMRPPLPYSKTVESYHYYNSPLTKNQIALTFDDGPRANTSEALMNVLMKAKAPATFFYDGSDILFHPDIVHDAYERGFEIGNLSFTHSPLAQSSERRLAIELHTTDYLIEHITGHPSEYYRPPYLSGIGADPTVNPYTPPPQDLTWVLQNGYNPVGSDLDPDDWQATSKDDVVARVQAVLERSPNGHILLLHETPYTVAALPNIISTLRESGYTIVSLNALLTPPTELTLTQKMSLGDTDETAGGEVSKLQWFLYRNGNLDPYLVSGTFDAATKAALTQFQLNAGLANGQASDAAVGTTDTATRNALHARSLSVLAAAATSIAQPLTPFSFTIWNGQLFADTYIYVFPVVRDTVSFMAILALILVFTRCVVVLLLFVWGYFAPPRDKLAKRGAKKVGVSVLIPAYNEQENIRATVESVLASKHPRKEIVVIDDGSTDKTGEVVRGVIADHPHSNVVLIQVPNGGKASALNHGMRVSKYDICAVLDADAVLDENALTAFASHFTDPKIGAVAGRVRTTASIHTLDTFQTLEYAIGQNIDKRALSAAGAIGVVPGPAGAWRRDAIMACGGFSTETLVEDQDMTLTLLRAGYAVCYEENAIAYTETPHSVKNFLKQRFRWVYGTIQCAWKHKRVVVERPLSGMTLLVMPNIVIFNILLPITYPFADAAFLLGLLLDDWQYLLLPFLFFTLFDLLYASIGVWREENRFKLLSFVPLQRIVYRQLLYYTVIRGVVRAIEGTGAGWNKFAKVGETQRFYYSAGKGAAPAARQTVQKTTRKQQETIPLPTSNDNYHDGSETVTVSFQGPSGTFSPSTNPQVVMSLSDIPRQSQSAGDISSPARAPYVFSGWTCRTRN